MELPEDHTFEPDETDLPADVEGFSKRRVELVQRATREWMRALVDLGGRNNLLHFRDLRRGTLDLTDAAPRGLSALLSSKAVEVSALFPDLEERDRALRRVRTIHNKAKENFEERGLETLSLACGFATWENTRSTAEPSAPVLLRQAVLRSLGAAQDEFELALVDEMEVNPTLLHLLKVDFDCDVEPEKLLNRVDGIIDESWELAAAYEWLKEHATRVPGFAIQPRLVLANFAYAKLPMVRDLENSFDELVAHDLIAAVAGDEEAQQKVRSKGPGPDAVPSPDHLPPADEFLVLDADSSQNYAINAVLGGESIIVKGPPGTGKSQTIANMISSVVARGKRVLFVAEKRAAIDAVLKRLHQQKLGDLVLDLHGGVSSRRAFAQAIGKALVASRSAPLVDFSANHSKLEKRRDELNAYVESLHGKREPWGISVYELRAELLGLPETSRADVRFRGATLERLDRKASRKVREDLSDYGDLGGFVMASSGRAWATADVASEVEARAAYDLVDNLRRHAAPVALKALEKAADETGIGAAESISGWQTHLALWHETEETLSFFRPSVFELDLDSLLTALAPAGSGAFSRFTATINSPEYRKARNLLREQAVEGKPSVAEAFERGKAALDQRQRWRQISLGALPTIPVSLQTLDGPYRQLLEELDRLGGVLRRSDLAAVETGELRTLLDQLAEDRPTLVTLPRLRELETSMASAGIEELLTELQNRRASVEIALQKFQHAWLQSILEHLALTDRRVEGFVAEKHERVSAEFRSGDRQHIADTASRIRRICAEQATRARDEFTEEAHLVQHQANLKTRHMPVRDLVRTASEVLLALKPCWAMSPLAVSQLLPPKTYFDIVIFDEASQITPADAIPSIMRGKQLVVAGDERQLPPTAFFASESPEDETEAEEIEAPPLVAGTKGFESILDALAALLRFKMLQWHYRSRDEALIAFSNAHIYDRQLVTFPGAGGDDVLASSSVNWDPAADTNSPTPEVNSVVDLIVDHARNRPDESLGAIAMGIKHASRIEDCLRERLRDDPVLEEELGEFFDETREERFFVKNLERVQGDERDAIILSIGYGRNARGDLPYRFGPLLMQGGERRLNVAVTRAKSRIHLVSSFTSRDMDPEKSSAEGVKLLRQYLQYVESTGANLGDQIVDKPILNPFEVDVRDALSRQGLKLTAQYGSSGYWIDFAVQHPTKPGQYVLAIECDGASYHSSESARDRDRLRQDQLERLGWCFHRIWSGEWFYDKPKATEKTLEAYRQAVAASDRAEPHPDHGSSTHEQASGLDGEVQAEVQAATRRLPPPRLPYFESINDIPISKLVQLIESIESDGLLRTERELLNETVKELGFNRRGHRIVDRVTEAIHRSRRGS